MAQEVSGLVISIDARNAERQAKQLDDKLKEITNSGNSASESATKLGSSLNASSKSTQTFTSSMAKASTTVSNNSNSVKGNIEALQDQSRAANASEMAMTALAARMAAVLTVGEAINRMDALTGYENRLKLVTNGQEELNTAMSDTFRIAQDSRQAWDSVVQVYQRFSENAKELGITMAKTAELTDTVSKAIAISGASAESAEASLVQFGQSLASGVFRGEEFNSVAEQTPALLKAIASGLDVNIGKLREMANNGELTSDVLVKALSNAKESVDELFGKTDPTIGQSFTQLNNAATKFVGEAGKASGAATALASSISLLANNLDTVADVAMAAGLAYLTKTILTKTKATYADLTATAAKSAVDKKAQADAVALTTAKVAEAKAHLANVQATNAETQAKFGATAANARYKVANDAVTASILAQNAAMGGVAKGATLASRAVGLVGGPIGLLTVAVGALSVGYSIMQKRAAEATEKLEEQAKVANETDEALRKLTGTEKQKAIDDLTATFENQTKELRKSELAMGSALVAVENFYGTLSKEAKVAQDARNGIISYDEALEKLNAMKISTAMYDRLVKEKPKYDENARAIQNTADKLSIYGKEVEISGNKAQNASLQNDMLAGSIGNVADAYANYRSSASKFSDDLEVRLKRATYISEGLAKGVSEARSNLEFDVLKSTGFNPALAGKGMELVEQVIELEEKNTSVIDANRKALQARSKAAKSDASARNKAAKQQERDEQQAANMRASIAYMNATTLEQIEVDHINRVKDIQKARFDPAIERQYINSSKVRMNNEKQLYEIRLAGELFSFKKTEEEKATFARNLKVAELIDSDRFSDEERKTRIRAANELHSHEMSMLAIEKRRRLFDAEQVFMSEREKIQERYEIELMEIDKIIDKEEQRRMLNAAEENKRIADRELTANLQLKYDQSRGIDTSADEAMAERKKLLDELLANGIISQEQYFAEVEEMYRQHQRNMLTISLESSESITGSMAEMFRVSMGEQSKAYKVMFAASKAFAIANASLSMYEAMANASALAFPLNLTEYARAAAQGLQIIQGVKAIKDVGFKSGGYTGNIGTSQQAGVVHGQEYVLNAEATKRVGIGTLDAVNSGAALGGSTQLNLTIQNYGTSKSFEVQQLSETDIRIIARDETEKTIQDGMRNPNSVISQSVSTNFETGRRYD